MARTNLVPDVIDPIAGKITPTVQTVDQANGNMFDANDRVILRVANTNAATRTVTITPGVRPNGFTTTPLTFVVPVTTGVAYIGPFPVSVFGQASGTDAGKVYVNIDASAGVTFELIRIP